MLKTVLAAIAAFTLMSGIGLARSSYSGSTTESTQIVPPKHAIDETTTVRRSEDRDGVLIEKDTSGTEVSRPGVAATTETKTDTTTTR